MKKSFAENCIRYISTATALILALAMLCCANFSASAKDLGSNLTITDTTSLLADINTTTNTTPAKTKDLIASGAGVEILSTGAYTGIIYIDTKNLSSSWSSVYLHYWGGDSSTWPGVTMTSVGDGVYSCDLSTKSGVTGCIFHNNSGTQTSDLTIPSTDNSMFVLNSDGKGGTWSTYSGGSSTSSNWTLRGDFNNWSATDHKFTGSGNTLTASVTLEANKTYKFKLNDGTSWYGNTGTMTSGNCTGWTFKSSEGDAGITTTSAGIYVFTLDTSTKKLSVTYPTVSNYTITFDANGGSVSTTSTTVTNGSTYGELPIPTYTGHTFDGWYTEQSGGTKIESTSTVNLTGNTTLYAHWTASATSDVSEDILAILNRTRTQAYFGHPSSNWKTDIYLKGGSSDLNKTKIGTTTLSDVSYYYADFTLDTTTNLKNYYISDASGWGGVKINKDELVVGGAFYYIINSGENDGNRSVSPTTAQTTLGATSFTVGTTDKLPVTTKATKATSSTGNALKYQYYIKNGTNYLRLGSTDITASISDTTTEFDISTLPKGTYELITMLYDGHIYYVSDTTETDTFTISDSYTVTFNANGHGDNTETTVEPGGKVSAPTEPTAKGYTFGGWYKESTCVNEYDFNTAVTGDLTLYAKWTANKYTVSFDSQDGDNTPADMEVTYDGTYGTLPSAGTKTGYDFAGWYTTATGGTQVSASTVVNITSDQTLYAQWTAKTYTVTLNKDGGTINSGDVSSYTYGVGEKLPTDVTKEGYTFLGWKDDETGSMVESISKTDTGNKSFTAQWKLNTFEHQYVFMEVSGKTWFYNDSSYGVVSFDGGTTYIDMQELFTNTSTYKSSAKKSNLLFAKVPEGTTTIIFSRKNTTDGVVSKNKTTYKYSDYTTNNLLTLASGNDTLKGSWSTVDYTPVPVSVTHGTNGTVVASKTLADTTTTITVKKGETKYFDSTTTGISVAVTPEKDYRIKSFTLVNNGEDIKNVFGNIETGGTYDLGTLSSTEYDIQATFEEVPKENPTVKIESIPNSTISFTYTDPAGTVQTATAPGDYVVQYKSDISLVISPNPGYHLVSITGLTTESTLPIAGNVTATATQVKENLTVTYELAKNPKVTIDVPSNCTVDFTYTNGNGTVTTDTVTTAITKKEYYVYYGSNVSYKVTPNDGFYVASMTGVTTNTPRPPVAEAVTGTISNITADVADTITCTLNPNPTVTIECYDSTGTKIESGAGITVDGGTEALTKQSKSVLYYSETGVTFTASADAEDVHHYRFLGYYTTKKPIGSPIESGGIDDYNVTVTDNSIKVHHVKENVTLYAIFSQQYKVTFNYENLKTFTVNGESVTNGGEVLVSSDANLSLVTTLSDDYKLTNDCWTIDPTGVGAFTPNGLSATYVSGSGDVTITITPKVATYTGEGKWGSKILKIDTSGVGASKTDYDPWFAAKFAKSSSGTDFTWVRFSKISDDSYECVVPDGYNYVRFCRMATKATTFTETTTDDIDATTAWNVTDSFISLENTSSEYTLAFVTGQTSKITAEKKTNN